MSQGWSGTIVGRRYFSGLEGNVNMAVTVRDGLVWDVGKQHVVKDGPDVMRLPKGYVVAPGLIDVQVNGGGGELLNTAPTLKTIEAMVAAHRSGGTTGMLPTLITDTPETLDALISIAPKAFALPGVLGLHLEGPFINPEKKGAHRADLIRKPETADINKLKQLASKGRLLVTLAPELFTEAQLRELSAAGIILSAGHTLATYEQMRAAADAGLTGVTHLYNAMAPLTARAPGVIGAALDDARLFVGVIADGHHVSESNLRLAIKAKTRAGVMLVTDAMATAGSSLKSFDLQGRRITKAGDRLTNPDGTLAGAHLTMIQAVQAIARMNNGDWGDAVVMAAVTPARFLGLSETHGNMHLGRHADLVAFHAETFDVLDTWINGHASPGGKAQKFLGARG